jgi:hypothetical protein
MIKRLFSTLMAALLICVSPLVRAEVVTENAPEGIPSQDPFYTDEYTVESSSNSGGRPNYITVETFSIQSNSVGKVTVTLAISTNAMMQKLGFTTLKVQHWNGSTWEDAWTKTDQYLYDTNYFPYVKTISNMASNDYYRLSVDLYAKKGFFLVQTETIVSSYIRCQ